MLAFTKSKINLGLQILSKRPDGYHDIATVMYPIAWGDILEIVPSQSGDTTLTVTGRHIDCPMEKNLVYKAYKALSDACDEPLPPVDIYLRKIVPDGAGLGGGSSDAATTLLVLRDMFALDMTDDYLAQLAATIGADCPLFIYNRPMLATGTGTTLSPIDVQALKGKTIVVVKPPESVGTAEAYAGVTPYPAAVSVANIIAEPIVQWRDKLVNDFETSVFRTHPLIGRVKEEMYAIGAEYAAMSGSGSAVFGIFGALPFALPDQWSRDGWSVWRSDSMAD